MRRCRSAILVLGACAGTEPQSVQPTAHVPAPAPASAVSPSRLQIVGQQVADGLRVTYQLPRAAASFRFLLPSGPIRSETWQVLTPGLVLANDAIESSAASSFERFEILITPDKAEYDRIYPALFSMGSGAFVLNTRYLAGDGFSDTTIELAAASENQILSSFHAPASAITFPATTSADGKGHYIYFGDDPPASSGATVVFASSTPEWLRTKLVDVANAAVPLLVAKLGQPLTTKPFIVVTYLDPAADQRTYRGDTAANGEIALRFRGRGWSTASAGDTEVAKFLLHELVHLWNGELARPPEGEYLAWLHEGSAEYLALLAATQLGVLTTAAFHEQIGRAINGCIDALGTGSLTDPSSPVRAGYYTCGVVVQWLAELSVKPHRDSFDIWKAVLATAVKGDRTYSVDLFLAEVKRHATNPLTSFVLSDPSQRDWSQLPRLVEPHGAKLERMTGPQLDAKRRTQLLVHVLKENCSGRYGFFNFEDHVRLDTGQHCGALSGDPEVAVLEGHDLYKNIDKAYGALQRACARSASVRLRARDGGTVTARCARSLPDPSPMFRVVATPS